MFDPISYIILEVKLNRKFLLSFLLMIYWFNNLEPFLSYYSFWNVAEQNWPKMSSAWQFQLNIKIK